MNENVCKTTILISNSQKVELVTFGTILEYHMSFSYDSFWFGVCITMYVYK